ncbi:hypothetical protein F5148DRAFT_495989 [Russula earlei]|uniref:Uncharacterized protein n=1 Tax=Russula earlei TaxID=71964 RepID=A0ACC0TY93_9AGAM|nr:hypothetical protein F5148DRAFT_495989 [Russula earlei]
MFPIPVTFRPRLWSPACRSCPELNPFTLNSNPLGILQVDVHFRSHALSSHLSPNLCSEVLTSILEDLLAQIEAPLLNKLKIGFFLDPHFVVPQLHQLINYAESFKKCHRAFVYTSGYDIRFTAFGGELERSLVPELSLAISDPHLPSLAQVCNSSLSLLSTLVRLDFLGDSTQTSGIETTQWLELLDPFTSVTDLRLDNEHVGRVLQKLAEERVKQVLPALQKISLIDLTEPVPKYMQGFVAARQLFGHPVAVCPWDDHVSTGLYHYWNFQFF